MRHKRTFNVQPQMDRQKTSVPEYGFPLSERQLGLVARHPVALLQHPRRRLPLVSGLESENPCFQIRAHPASPGLSNQGKAGGGHGGSCNFGNVEPLLLMEPSDYAIVICLQGPPRKKRENFHKPSQLMSSQKRGRDGMTLKDVLNEAIKRWGWQERIQHDVESETDFVGTTYLKHNKAFVYTLTTNDKFHKIGIYVKAPIQAPIDRIIESSLIANYFNIYSTTGSYYVTESGDICYRWMLSVAGTQASVEMFRALRDAASRAFEETYNSFLAAAFTSSSVLEIIQKYQMLSSKR